MIKKQIDLNKNNSVDKRLKRKKTNKKILKNILSNKTNKRLVEEIKNIDTSFSETLIKIIDRKKIKDTDVYYRANMDRKLFSKIRNGSHPKKITAISLCIALELNYEETNNLISKAGYILNNSEIFDVIISYFIKNKNYNIYDINEALLSYDQPQLGFVGK